MASSITNGSKQEIDGRLHVYYDGYWIKYAPPPDMDSLAAKRKCETLRTDPDIFTIWPEFVVAGERLTAVEPQFPLTPTKATFRLAEQGMLLLQDGKALVTYIARARVPMPKSCEEYLGRCNSYRESIGALSADAGGCQTHLGTAT